MKFASEVTLNNRYYQMHRQIAQTQQVFCLEFRKDQDHMHPSCTELPLPSTKFHFYVGLLGKLNEFLPPHFGSCLPLWILSLRLYEQAVSPIQMFQFLPLCHGTTLVSLMVTTVVMVVVMMVMAHWCFEATLVLWCYPGVGLTVNEDICSSWTQCSVYAALSSF